MSAEPRKRTLEFETATDAQPCCGLEPVVEFVASETELKRVAYAVAVVCPKCRRRVEFRHAAFFVVPEPDYDRRVRLAAIRRWNAALASSATEAAR